MGRLHRRQPRHDYPTATAGDRGRRTGLNVAGGGPLVHPPALAAVLRRRRHRRHRPGRRQAHRATHGRRRSARIAADRSALGQYLQRVPHPATRPAGESPARPPRTGRPVAGPHALSVDGLFARREDALRGHSAPAPRGCRRQRGNPGPIARRPGPAIVVQHAGGPRGGGEAAAMDLVLPQDEGVYDIEITADQNAGWPRALRQSLRWKRAIVERRLQLVVISPLAPAASGRTRIRSKSWKSTPPVPAGGKRSSCRHCRRCRGSRAA